MWPDLAKGWQFLDAIAGQGFHAVFPEQFFDNPMGGATVENEYLTLVFPSSVNDPPTTIPGKDVVTISQVQGPAAGWLLLSAVSGVALRRRVMS